MSVQLFTSSLLNVVAREADPGRVATIRWLGIAIVVVGLSVIFLRWWRER